MSTPSPEPPARQLDQTERTALEQAWDDYEAGDLQRAGQAVDHLMRRTKRHPEVRLLQAVLWLDAGQPAQALADLEACAGAIEDAALLAFYRGLTLFDLARFQEAEAALLEAAGTGEPVVTYQLAQVREHLGRFDQAEEDYRRAHAADPAEFPLPLRMAPEEFREVVAQAGEHLPDPVRDRLNEVPVVIEALPQAAILAESGDGIIGPDLLGLFVGTNLREESVFEVPGVPAAIYIYQRNLERVCRSRDELIEEITTTLYHELGHYLGLDEDELRDRDLD